MTSPWIIEGDILEKVRNGGSDMRFEGNDGDGAGAAGKHQVLLKGSKRGSRLATLALTILFALIAVSLIVWLGIDEEIIEK